MCSTVGGVQYCGGVQYHGGYHDTCGDILSTAGDVQYHGRYHDKCEDILSTMGVFFSSSVHRATPFKTKEVSFLVFELFRKYSASKDYFVP